MLPMEQVVFHNGEKQIIVKQSCQNYGDEIIRIQKKEELIRLLNEYLLKYKDENVVIFP